MVISALTERANLENIAFGIKIISAGTNTLTLPGMLVFIITGVWMGYVRYGLTHHAYQLMLLLITLSIVNGYFFVAPLVASATKIAARSLEQGHLLPEYKAVFAKESNFGLINILLLVASAVIGLW
jgi:hypothetical protein